MGDESITRERMVERLADSFAGDLGVEPLHVADDEASARIVVDRRHLHPGRLVHGGVYVSLADTVAALGTFRHLGPGQSHTTVELKANLISSAGEGDELVATARPVHLGRRTQVWEVRVQNGDRLAATFTCTQMVLDGDGSG